jgi:esterase/lipase superfamily enzyme
MTVPFGINAWFETGDTLAFRPVRIESHTTYTLTFDVSAAPYGSVTDLYGSWLSGALDALADRSSSDGEPRTVTLEIVPNDEIEVVGDATATVVIDPERWQTAAEAQPPELPEDAWLAAMDYAFVLPEGVGPRVGSPLLVARFQLRVRTGELSDHPSLRVNLYEGTGDEAQQIDDSVLAFGDEDLTLVWGAPPPPARPRTKGARPTTKLMEAVYPQEENRTVTVFYATDRVDTGSATPHERYSGESSRHLTLGTLQVNIPKGHEEGAIERPIFGWHRLEDPQKHVILLSISPLPADRFYTQLSGVVAATNRREAFVFVHGFRVTFEAAALRTGQMAYDFQRLGLDAVPVLYSWPSAGSTAGYVADLDSSELSASHLAGFLADLRRRSGADIVHLIGHSMGNQVLTRALKLLRAEHGLTHFNEVVLAAPDIGVEIFRQTAAEIRNASNRMTLYANSKDKALDAAEALRLGRRRAGDVENGRIVVVDGVESIDASGLDTGFLGHSYFAQEQHVIRDVTRVMSAAAPPEDRPWLRRRESGDEVWWAFTED